MPVCSVRAREFGPCDYSTWRGYTPRVLTPQFTIDIDPDIRKASILPGSFYSDQAVFDACRERIFPASWQLVGHSELVSVPGSVYPFTLLDGCLDEPLLLTRDYDDRLH